MNNFLKVNKTILTYSLIILLVIPIFGINLCLIIAQNPQLLEILIPLFIFLLIFIGFNYYKSKFNQCSNCGAISLGLSDTCITCGADLNDINKRNQFDKKPSESTIEVIAEEIK